MERNVEHKLSRRNLWGFAVGAIPSGLLAFIFSLKYVEFFYQELQLLPVYFVIGQVIYMVVNALNDPLLGQLSDRTNPKKWGSKRLIYIKYGAPIWALTFMLLWIPWSFTNQILIFLHYVISICLFDTMLTLVILVWLALLPAMTSDLDERNKGNFLVVVLGGIVVIPFLLILAPMNPTSSEFLILNVFIAVICTLLLWLTVRLCQEKPEFQKDQGLPLFKAAKETLKSRSFLIYLGYIFCNAFLSSIGLSYLFVYVLILGEGGILSYFFIFVVIGYGSMFYCLRLQSKWGMRRLMLRFGVVKVIVSFITFFLILVIDEPLITVIGLAILTFFGGYTIFNTPLLYLSIDEDELKTGSRREGMFFGINALIHKPSQSIGPIVATMILTFFNYDPTPEAIQPPEAIIGIKILMFLIPAVVSAIGLAFLYKYPIHNDVLKDLQAKLNILHEEKRQQIKK
ncbi:MAG: MFS transporter [Promethearchaeota archaeon]|jgi:GPH family glycoside/pentoside/hexuronide:cation symporter